MKKILCLILVFFMLASSVGCENVANPLEGSNDVVQDPTTEDPATEDPTTEDPATEDPTTETPTTEEPTTEEPTYDGVFQTGYSRVCITPSVPTAGYTRVADDIYATCLAVHDGENTILIISIDMQSMLEDKCDSLRERVKAATGLSLKNIFITATHTHSSVYFGNNDWTRHAYNKIGAACKEAIADLSDTEMFIGTGKTTGMAFVRRYINSDGTMSSVNPSSNSIRCVSEADDTLQVVRFVRKDKKDIIATNWQAHLAHAINALPTSISSDIAHYVRRDVEAGDDDALVIYFAGASGNINLNPPNRSFKKYRSYVEVGEALAKLTLEVMKPENLTKIQSGKIGKIKKDYVLATKLDPPEDVAAAQARQKAGTASSGDNYMVARNRSKSMNFRIAAFSFGDLAFITAPYEMFDTNGMQIKEGSPFKMTFILTNSDGALAYMPSYEACTEYGGYETVATYFGAGAAERVVGEYISMLNKLKQAQ